MNKFVMIFDLLMILSMVSFPWASTTTPTDQEIGKSYISSDHGTAVRLLEQQINEQREKLSRGERVEYLRLYKQYLLLAHIYAWRLNQPDVALSKYHEFNESKKTHPPSSNLLTFELLYMGEIYEARRDRAKAKKYYQDLLNKLADFAGNESDDVSILISEDLIKFVRYQIDSLQIKACAEERHKPLLPRLKLSSQLTHHLTPFLVLSLVPGAEYLFSRGNPTDLVNKIQQSPPDVSSMILNYALIMTDSASHIDESSENTMEAYLAKYPESYYSLQLRYLFYKYYKESEQTRKARKLQKEFDKIANKRGMELIIEPDKRFSSPEKTWETYKNALMAGDIDLATECYVPGRRGHGKVYDALGREKMKEIGRSMGEIHKVKAGEAMAEYVVVRNEGGKEYSYAIRFQNIDGEWRMYEF